MTGVFVLTLIGGVGLLTLAVWPGLIESVVFAPVLVCVWLSLFGGWSVPVAGLAVRDLACRLGWWGVRSAVVMLATLGLLREHVPQRVAFALYEQNLAGLVADAPVDEFRGRELNRRVGPYRVDRYAADGRGGVFLRTATGPDGIGPDQKSYGFAFRPNPQGTPFGNAKYDLRHLSGDWYMLAASDDW